MNYRFDDDGNILPPEPKSIYEINCYIKDLIEEEALLQEVCAVGEISNFKKHSSGHIYLSLKDDKSEIRAVMFRSYAQKMRFKPQDGMKVIVRGRIGVYPQGGSYQFYIEDMQPDGVGALHLAFEQLKASLLKEGLFDQEHKRPIPAYPKIIGVVTSPTGAAIRDIIKVISHRYPVAKIILYPTLVQGQEAPPQIIKGIEYFNIIAEADVLIVGRGGGSMEDLWAFNDEALARAVYNSKIPVISAVGHEIDFTICDFVADVRAATPSHAAELATPDLNEIVYRLNDFSDRAINALIDNISSCRARLDDAASSRALTKPLSILDIPTLKVNALTERLVSIIKERLNNKREKFIYSSSKLSALNPMSVLSRGYGAIFDKNEKVIKSINDVNIGENVTVKIRDGSIKATVYDVERKNTDG